MMKNNLPERVALGAAAGLVGTLAIQVLRTASQKWAPQTMPPVRQEPGSFMTRQAERFLPDAARRNITHQHEQAASKAMGIGYGLMFGAAYAALRPEGGSSWLDGALLGVATWAAGYLGWLPAAGLMSPVWEHSPAQAVAPVVRHAAYGVATVAAYDLLQHELVS